MEASSGIAGLIAGSFAVPGVGTQVRSQLPGWLPAQETGSAEQHRLVMSSFERYLACAYHRYCRVDSGIRQNAGWYPEDYYFPLKVRSVGAGRTSAVRQIGMHLIENPGGVLLLGPSGSGKTTALLFLFSECLKTKASIPFLIELQRLPPKATVLDALRQELNADAGIDNNALAALIYRGGFVFLFDGLEEVASTRRDEMIRQIAKFCAKAGGNRFVLVARPESAPFIGLNIPTFTIEPLILAEAVALMRRCDQNGALSRRIVSRLRANSSKQLRQFLSRPRRVWMLYKSYELLHQCGTSRRRSTSDEGRHGRSSQSNGSRVLNSKGRSSDSRASQPGSKTGGPRSDH